MHNARFCSPLLVLTFWLIGFVLYNPLAVFSNSVSDRCWEQTKLFFSNFSFAFSGCSKYLARKLLKENKRNCFLKPFQHHIAFKFRLVPVSLSLKIIHRKFSSNSVLWLDSSANLFAVMCLRRWQAHLQSPIEKLEFWYNGCYHFISSSVIPFDCKIRKAYRQPGGGPGRRSKVPAP